MDWISKRQKTSFCFNKGKKEIKLKYTPLKQQDNIFCNYLDVVIRDGRKRITNRYFVIELKNSQLEDVFTFWIKSLLQSINAKTTSNDLYELIKSYILLFEKSKNTDQTLQGLWTELFLISISKNPKTAVDCWHTEKDNKVDFMLNNYALEVKSTKSSERRHDTSLDQINKCQYTIIASFVNIEKNDRGKSLQSLQKSVNKHLTLKQKTKINDIIISTIGGTSFNEDFNCKFNDKLAETNLKFYNIASIKKAINLPNEIIDSTVKFKIDFSYYSVFKTKSSKSPLINNF